MQVNRQKCYSFTDSQTNLNTPVVQVQANTVQNPVSSQCKPNEDKPKEKNLVNKQVKTQKEKRQFKLLRKPFNWVAFLSSCAGLGAGLFLAKNMQGAKKLWGKEGIKFADNYPAVFTTMLGAVTGGLIGGYFQEKGKNFCYKLKESVFQITALTIPTLIIDPWMKHIEAKDLEEYAKKYAEGKPIDKALKEAFHLKEASKPFLQKIFNMSVLKKLGAVAFGLGAGVPAAAWVSNKLNNALIKQGGECERKVHVCDYLVDIDDAVVAMAVSGNPFFQAILPLVYIISGYRVADADSFNSSPKYTSFLHRALHGSQHIFYKNLHTYDKFKVRD